MTFLRLLSPLRAIRDLRRYLAQRQRYELVFLMLAIVTTGLVIIGFYLDSRVAVPYERNIIYVESWPENRTDAQIIAQQKIDLAKRRKREAELEKKAAERRAAFQRLDNQLEAWGL